MPNTSCSGPRTPALSTYALPIAATAHAPLRRQGGGGEWAGRLSPGPIGSEGPRPPGRWTELDPSGGRRRRGQPCGRGGGGAQGLEAGPGAVSPAPAAAAAAVPYMSWPRWLPALPTAVRRPGIPSRLPPCRPGAQVRPAALPSHRVPLLGSGPPRGRPLRAVSAPRLPLPPGGGPGGRDDRPPHPPHTSGRRACSRVPGPRLRIPAWGWSRAPPSRADYTIAGAGGRGPSRASAPHLSPCRAPRQRADNQRDSGGPESFTLWSGFVDI